MSYLDSPCFSDEEIRFAKIEAEQAVNDARDADKARDDYWQNPKKSGKSVPELKKDNDFMEEFRELTIELIEERLWMYFKKDKVDFMIQSNIDVKLGKKTIQQIRKIFNKKYDVSKAVATWNKRDKIYKEWEKIFSTNKLYIGYPDFKNYG